MCQCLQTELASAKESAGRKEKMFARRSKGRLLHIMVKVSLLKQVGVETTY